jgi:hypothetical protein
MHSCHTVLKKVNQMHMLDTRTGFEPESLGAKKKLDMNASSHVDEGKEERVPPPPPVYVPPKEKKSV